MQTGDFSVPDVIPVTRGYRFENSDYKEYLYFYTMSLIARPKGMRKSKRQSSDDEIWKSFSAELGKLIPQIVYFPTFLFTQPQRIYLTSAVGETTLNRLYREITEDVARSLQLV
jgi:hypothetical protein